MPRVFQPIRQSPQMIRLSSLMNNGKAQIAIAAIAALIFLATACGYEGSGNPSKSEQPATNRTQSETGHPNSPTSRSTVAQDRTQYLSDLEPLMSTQGVDNGAATVNGAGFPRSVSLSVNAAGPVNEAEYNIGRQWPKFRATIGLRDDSPTGGQLSFEIRADGKSIFKRSVSLGQAQDVSLDLNGALRLKLTLTYSGQDSANYYYGTWGEARLES
ncbi:NPCBM/NEW2 domain-containing protein [Streptomyces decoyicus]